MVATNHALSLVQTIPKVTIVQQDTIKAGGVDTEQNTSRTHPGSVLECVFLLAEPLTNALVNCMNRIEPKRPCSFAHVVESARTSAGGSNGVSILDAVASTRADAWRRLRVPHRAWTKEQTRCMLGISGSGRMPYCSWAE